jgi:5-(carboxyamino)imidazole ribonucleotide mutase
LKLKVAVLAGSKSDAELVEKAVNTLSRFGIEAISAFISAHRQPEKLEAFIKEHDAEVFCYIAIAGLAAHLPGVVASKTIKPVIGVPGGGAIGGLDSLLSIVQMPKGVPVATVGIKIPENAAILAAQIASIFDDEVRKKLVQFKQELKEQ